MINKLFAVQKQYINYFFDTLDGEQAEHLLQLLLSCQGVIFFAGIGKSGIIAQKIAATLVSTGTKAMYLPAVDALHGDIGIVSKEDIFVLLSKSGESEELLRLVPYVRAKQATIVGIVSNANSRLSKACDHVVYLPLERELCPFDLSPTTSTAIQLIFGDVLAVGLMKARGFSIDDYAMNHPSGRIGRRMNVLVRDLMLTGDDLPLCVGTDQLSDKLVELSNKRCGCLLVLDEKGGLAGIFTDGDLRRALQTKGVHVLEEKMEHLMTKTPKCIASTQLAWEAMQFMESDAKHPVMMLPVVEDDKVVGLIKLHDLVQGGF